MSREGWAGGRVVGLGACVVDVERWRNPIRRRKVSHHIPPTSWRCSYNTKSRLVSSSSWRSTRTRSIARPALPPPTTATDLFPCADCCRGAMKSPCWSRMKLSSDRKNWRTSNMTERYRAQGHCGYAQVTCLWDLLNSLLLSIARLALTNITPSSHIYSSRAAHSYDSTTLICLFR